MEACRKLKAKEPEEELLEKIQVSAQPVYYSGGSEKQSAGVKEQVYHAFMNAVSEKNRELLKQEKGSPNQFRLNLGISPSARNTLNGIWDYYANLRDKNA